MPPAAPARTIARGAGSDVVGAVPATGDESHDLPYPPSRRLTFDVGRLGRQKHRVHALVEVDVTDARARIKAHRRAGLPGSFTAWAIKTIADAVAAHPEVAGYHRPGRNRVAVFRDVDVALVVERSVAGARVPLPLVIRRADAKTAPEIGAEIAAAKAQAVADEGDLVLGRRRDPLPMRVFLRLPQVLRLVLMRVAMLGSPERAKAAMGNVMVTTVGMAGRARGWIVPTSVHPLCVALGSIGEQPAVHRGEVVPRTILRMTVLIDHDVVDGIPAARFVAEAVRRLEAAAGL